jgi:hypothetical protein
MQDANVPVPVNNISLQNAIDQSRATLKVVLDGSTNGQYHEARCRYDSPTWKSRLVPSEAVRSNMCHRV